MISSRSPRKDDRMRIDVKPPTPTESKNTGGYSYLHSKNRGTTRSDYRLTKGVYRSNRPNYMTTKRNQEVYPSTFHN